MSVIAPIAGLLVANVALAALVGLLYAMLLHVEKRLLALERRLAAAHRWQDDPHDTIEAGPSGPPGMSGPSGPSIPKPQK
jgi:hypothetical protein